MDQITRLEQALSASNISTKKGKCTDLAMWLKIVMQSVVGNKVNTSAGGKGRRAHHCHLQILPPQEQNLNPSAAPTSTPSAHLLAFTLLTMTRCLQQKQYRSKLQVLMHPMISKPIAEHHATSSIIAMKCARKGISEGTTTKVVVSKQHS
ncbi:hypothetical protein L218DRAFT_1004200 [Marasmius fiardii PR-910]|nr:hypothetical protein L218DRAFT_1004200 [Marasmius fiardii PR-910]